MRIALLGGSVLALLVSAPASATIIDFDTYAPQNTCGTVSTGGIDFATTTGICVAVWSPNPVSTNGTPALIYGYGNLVMTATGGGLFQINSLLGGISWYSSQTSYLVNAIYTLADNSTFLGSATVGQGFQTYFPYNGLIKKAEFSGLPDGYFAIDNFDVNVLAVPEPANWALLIAGFGLVGAAMRRRQVALAA